MQNGQLSRCVEDGQEALRRRTYFSSVHLELSRKLWHFCNRSPRSSSRVSTATILNCECRLTLSSALAELGEGGIVLLDVAQLLAESTVEGVQVELATFELLQIRKCSRRSEPRLHDPKRFARIRRLT